MRIFIREDAFLAIKDNAIFQQSGKVGVLYKNSDKYIFIEIDPDTENCITQEGINLNDIDQVSDFILSVGNPNR